MKQGKRINKSSPKGEIFRKSLKKFSDIQTFRGLVFATILSGVVVGVILLVITPGVSNLMSSTSNRNLPDTITSDAPDSDTPNPDMPNPDMPNPDIPDPDMPDLDMPDLDASGPDDVAPIDGTTDNTSLDDTAFNDSASYKITSNGTMPRGTAPIDIAISEDMEEILAAIPKLSVGSSKEWVDKKLGPPFATNIVKVTEKGRIRYNNEEIIDVDGNTVSEDDIVDELLECVYLLDDIISATLYFDSSDKSCEAFFVTLLKDTLDFDIVMPEIYSSFVSDKPLGEFAFTEIVGEPDNVYGYVSQGVGRAFYGEQHYFMGWGNYQDFYFAVLDYGMLSSYIEFGGFLSMVQTEISPLNDSTNIYHSSDLLIQQRDALYPNTYGISTLGCKITFSLLGTYVAFDSLPLRG